MSEAAERPVPPPDQPGEVLLEARELSCGYGHMSVVRGLDLPVVAGEVAALIGPNGAGKTTTLLTLAGELPPTSGEVRWLGKPSSCTDARALQPGPELRHRGTLGDHEAHGLREPPPRERVGGGRDLAVSRARAALEASGGSALGRRAADADRRPGAGPKSHGDAARRAVARTRADHRAAAAPGGTHGQQGARRRVCCSWSSTFVRRSRWQTACT